MLARPGARAGKGRLGLSAGHLEGWVGEDMGKGGWEGGWDRVLVGSLGQVHWVGQDWGRV